MLPSNFSYKIVVLTSLIKIVCPIVANGYCFVKCLAGILWFVSSTYILFLSALLQKVPKFDMNIINPKYTLRYSFSYTISLGFEGFVDHYLSPVYWIRLYPLMRNTANSNPDKFFQYFVVNVVKYRMLSPKVYVRRSDKLVCPLQTIPRFKSGNVTVLINWSSICN